MGNPVYIVVMCLSYVYFVKFLGPKLMKNRKPFDLSGPMLLYNILTVIYNATIAFAGALYYFVYQPCFLCDRIDDHSGWVQNGQLILTYAYFLLKLAEFSDTIFAVLRKKQSQVSNLHVLHHGILPFSCWLGIKFYPGGHCLFFGWANSIVHVVMYTYYALASLGPEVQKHLWWKRYLTQLQLTHFVLIALHQSIVFFQPKCDYPKLLAGWIIGHAVVFFVLFLDFYKQTYKKMPIGASNSLHSKKVKDSHSSKVNSNGIQNEHKYD
ncbi:very long chain fatty acid elongase AAEL008004-like [Brevipalpus obovatus]|uniref:very long chain fatty acid elongase AAEL008004-like n=1 Tax=Brevipalpus obovatus TaxID=246614 RepID=UPI003D9E5AC8